jgi:hypothetical protein
MRFDGILVGEKVDRELPYRGVVESGFKARDVLRLVRERADLCAVDIALRGSEDDAQCSLDGAAPPRGGELPRGHRWAAARAVVARARPIRTSVNLILGVRRLQIYRSQRRWLAEQRQLLEDVEQCLQLSPEAGRRILRICLPKPLIVNPDGHDGWTFSGKGRFLERDLRKLTFALKNREIGGHVRSTPNPDPLELVAPG